MERQWCLCDERRWCDRYLYACQVEGKERMMVVSQEHVDHCWWWLEVSSWNAELLTTAIYDCQLSFLSVIHRAATVPKNGFHWGSRYGMEAVYSQPYIITSVVVRSPSTDKLVCQMGRCLEIPNLRFFVESRGVRSSDDGCQICHGTLTAAISELQQQQTQVNAQDTQSNVLPLFYYH